MRKLLLVMEDILILAALDDNLNDAVVFYKDICISCHKNLILHLLNNDLS